MVAHEKLLQKLHRYCIRGDTLLWIKKNFWTTENSQWLQTALIQTLFPFPLVSRNALFSDHPISSLHE